MVDRTLSNPTVEVNNDIVSIVPNSMEYKRGRGDITIRTQSAGGNSVELIKTENAETKKSYCKFSVFPTKTNSDLIKQWQGSTDGNTIRLSDGTFTESFRKMFIITDPTVALGADTVIEIEFEGQALV